MSLLFNQLTATLSADLVSLSNRPRGFGNHSAKQLNSPVSTLVIDPVWQNAVNHLESLLVSMQIKAKTQFKIILSSHFVRYLVLPTQPISMNKQEKSAYVVEAYRQVYGDIVDCWQIKLQDAAPNQPVIAIAIDKNLLTALKQISAKYQMSLTSVQPYLMHAFNAVSKLLGNINGYLVIVETGRLLIVVLNCGNCHSLRSIAVGEVWQANLRQLLMRESVNGDVAGNDVLVYQGNQKNIKIENIEGWNIRQIGLLPKKLFSGNQVLPQELSA